MGEIIVRNMLSWLELLINRYCCIWLVVYIIISMMHGHTKIKFLIVYSILGFKTVFFVYVKTELKILQRTVQW